LFVIILRRKTAQCGGNFVLSTREEMKDWLSWGFNPEDLDILFVCDLTFEGCSKASVAKGADGYDWIMLALKASIVVSKPQKHSLICFWDPERPLLLVSPEASIVVSWHRSVHCFVSYAPWKRPLLL